VVCGSVRAGNCCRYTERRMKFFLDTANLEELRKGAQWGIVDGVTTNPSLIAKEGKPIKEQVAAICEIVDGPVSAEVISTEAKAMIQEGRELSKIHKNIIVKVPLIRDGIEACSALSKEGIRVNVTLCFSAAQALIAAKAGAYFVSPFVGRLDDVGSEGLDLIRQIVAIYENYGFGTQILAASLRGPMHVIDSALAGAHIGTMPFKVMDQLFNHPLTDKGLEQFLKDYNKAFHPEPVR
jgi:transaldolase